MIKVAADIFDDSIDVAETGFGINIETIFILWINGSLSLWERRGDMLFSSLRDAV